MNARHRQEQLTRRLSLFFSSIMCLWLLMMLLSGRQTTPEIFIRIVMASLVAVILYRFLTRKMRRRAMLRKQPFPAAWETILQGKVQFFQTLAESEQARFREKVRIFLNEKRTPVSRHQLMTRYVSWLRRAPSFPFSDFLVGSGTKSVRCLFIRPRLMNNTKLGMWETGMC